MNALRRSALLQPRLQRIGSADVVTIDACRLRKVETVSRFAAGSLLTLVEMVDTDLGVTFLPGTAEGSAMLRNTRVKTYPLKDGSHREIGLAWRKGSSRADEFGRLGELIAECGLSLNRISGRKNRLGVK